MAERDLQHNSHNTARCFVHLVNNYTALNPNCWDLVKLLVKSAGPLGHMFILKEKVKVFEKQTFTEYLQRGIISKLCKTHTGCSCMNPRSEHLS